MILKLNTTKGTNIYSNVEVVEMNNDNIHIYLKEKDFPYSIPNEIVTEGYTMDEQGQTIEKIK